MNLSDKFSIFSGYAFKEFNTSQHGVPIIKIGNITADGRLNVDDVQYSTQKPNEKFYAQKGDFLIALSGATTGKSTIYSLADKQYLVNQRVGIIRPINKNPRTELFFKYYLQYISRLILHRAHGSAQPNISPKDLAKFTIPSVDENEQAHIGELLSSIEEGIRVKETQLKALDELIQSRFTEMFGKRFLSERIPLKNIATFTIGLTYKPVNVSKDGIIVLRSGNIQNNRIELEDDIVRVSNIKIPDDKFIKENDILMCARNGSAKLVGKSCLISNLKEPMTFGAFMTVVRSRYPYFLQSFFTSSFFKAQLVNTATASVKQITSTMLGDYLVIQTSDTDETQFAQFVQQVEKAKEIVKIQIKDLQELLALKMDEYFK